MLAQGFIPLPQPLFQQDVNGVIVSSQSRRQPSVVADDHASDEDEMSAEPTRSYCVIPLTSLGSRDLINIHFTDATKLPPNYDMPWRWREGVPSKSVLEKFDTLEPMNSTVGTVTGNDYRPEVRQSRVLKDLELSARKFEVPEDLWDLFPSRFAESSIEMFKNRDGAPRRWQLHAYDVGGFFARHTDGQKDPSHFGTLLLFPPAQLDDKMSRGHDAAVKIKRLNEQPPTVEPAFAGGTLILYPHGKMPVRIEPASFKCWTLVAFHLDVAHECTPVTVGRRFVFKTELDLPRTGYFDNDVPATAADRAPVTQPDGTLEYRNKIDELERKITKYKRIIASLESNQLTPRVQKILRQIEGCDKIMVAMTTPTVVAKPTSLIGEEAQLWNAVLDRWPYSTLTTIDVQHNAGDGSGGTDEFYVNEDKLGCSVIPFRNPNNHSPGDLVHTDSEYNDQTYNTVNKYRVVAICVQQRRPGQSDDDEEDSGEESVTKTTPSKNQEGNDDDNDNDTAAENLDD